MKAYKFENKKIIPIEKKIPEIKKSEALIKIKYSGICNTDLELFSGYYNFSGIAGHEFVGEVIKSYNKQLLGKRVVGDINISCGICEYCKTGLYKHCKNRSVLGILNWDGAFSEYIKLPEKNLHIVADSIDDTTAVFAEPLAAALEPSQQYNINYDKSILILGDGKLGLLSSLGLHFFSNNILLIGKHKEKLNIAARQGIKTILLEEANKIIKDKKFDIIVEATGSSSGMDLALNYIKPRGTIFLKTTINRNINLDISRIAVDEINIIGSRCGNFDQALYFLEHKIIDVKPLIQNIYNFNNFENAFLEAKRRGSLKILLKYDN